MTRRVTAHVVWLWAAFLGIHLVTAIAGWVYPSQPMGDVVLVYEPWATSALSGGAIVGVSETWVYPQLALLPMMLAKILSLPLVGVLGVSAAYLIAWVLLVSIVDVVVFGVLLGRSPSGPRRSAAWFWCAGLLLLGPVALYRIDAITLPIAVLGVLWVVRRPGVAAALFTIAAWIKIWPGALLVAAIVAGRARVRMLIVACAVTVAVIATLLLLGARDEVWGFLTEQGGRGLQIEAVGATPFLWLALFGEAQIAYSFEILTFQIAAPGADAVGAALTPVMVLMVGAVLVTGVIRVARGAAFARMFAPLSLALVTTLIVANKVGSPQFQVWLIAPVIAWILFDRTRAAVPVALTLVSCALTCLVYPLSYDALLRAELLPVLILTLRNIVLMVLLAVSVLAVVRAPSRHERRALR